MTIIISLKVYFIAIETIYRLVDDNFSASRKSGGYVYKLMRKSSLPLEFFNNNHGFICWSGDDTVPIYSIPQLFTNLASALKIVGAESCLLSGALDDSTQTLVLLFR